ncbi:MAG: response regulator transcription factor [Christensenellaceae bacterium]|nr:response regulator transcription factor [Christensenellaceae bacterium]MCI6669263.1 response regulator transcription factor [Christensenellaceae bacterium]MCI6943398.1 response regulator transcription factor [Christensenellaceae bacterium]MCI7374979.1 response regulator transcription factor [Christensenellaceae bacterium]MDY3976456.1 response regulator transcription factor [Eubacteriales bacterium]
MSNKYLVVIVEDEYNISSFVSAVLQANGFDTMVARNGAEAIILITSHCPDLVLLDLGLPDMDGQGIIENVRGWSNVPIIVVSARTRERDKVMALESGADDYITKPFGTSELLARIRTALRHVQLREGEQAQRQTGVFHTGDLEVDYDKRRVYVNGEDAHLTQNEYKIVALLSKYSGRVLTYDSIIKHIWGPNAKQGNQILRVNMANIRRKIEPSTAEPRYIMTEMGVGYRMAEGED